jgi:microcystin-dependent protein
VFIDPGCDLPGGTMSQPFIGQIYLVGFTFAPPGYAFCDGSLLPISEFTALYQLIGTIYGGNGTVTFALPDLRSRVPIHQGQGTGLSPYVIGQAGGTENVTLTVQQIPSHTHVANCSSNSSNSASPVNAIWAKDSGSDTPYAAQAKKTMLPNAIGPAGGSLPHENMQPFMGINYIIALFGIFPSQS